MPNRTIYTVWVDGTPTAATNFEAAAETWDRLTLGQSVPGGISIQEYDSQDNCYRDGWLLHVHEDRSVYIHPRALTTT